jgi:outer membrane autotransporter protein
VVGTIVDGGDFGGTGGSLVKTGSGTLILTGTNTYTGGTTINGGTLQLGNGTATGSIVGNVIDNGTLAFARANTTTFAGAISGSGAVQQTSGALLILTGANTYTGGTTVTGGALQIGVAGGAMGSIAGNVTNNATFQVVNADTSGLSSVTTNGVTIFVNSSSAGTATLTTNAGGFTGFRGSATAGQASLVTNAGGSVDISGLAATAMTAGSIAGAGNYNLGGMQLTVGSNNQSTTVSGVIADGGLLGGTGASLVKVGSGTLTLSGANTYTGGTTVSGGLINFSAPNNFGTGAIALNGGGLQWATGTTTDISSRLAPSSAGATFDTGGNNVTFASALSGSGGLVKQGSGILNLAASNTYTGPTSVTAGTLAVNGSITSNVTVGAGGTLGGNGIITGSVVNAGTLAPGNSIGTLTVAGSYTQAAGSIYQVEVNAAGQGDRINASGTAAINGGTVQVLAHAGSYARNTTYTILSATSGVSGTYSGVTSNFAFLIPSLSYDANNVYLMLFQNQSAFAAGAQTANQFAVGTVLDQANASATGDLNTVLNAMSVLSNTQGPAALNAISGQPYADFGTMNVQSGVLFMSTVGQQMALARGGVAGGGQRQALAQACEIEACDAVGPWGVWASALGGLGNVAGNGNSSTLTFNFGGAAAGIDYRLDPRFLVGLGAGYAAGNQWVDSFMGRGWTDSVSVTAYASFTQAGYYVDGLAGYAYSSNQMQRQILIPGLQLRTANGSTGANQFLGQVEAGYKVAVFAPAAATVTPFGRLQISSVTQNGFSEWGSANALDLNVAQQTTNSLRTTVGADLAGSIGLGDARTLGLALRLGWLHEFADTGRPITAAFAGAPSNAFTVYGATPQRDSAVIGFLASTTVAEATQVYLRYDGEISSGAGNHTLNVGVRFTW